MNISKTGNFIYSKLKENPYLIFVLFAALFIRIYSAAINGIGYTIDSQNYIKQAGMLLEGRYSLYFPNGYPLIVALFISFKKIFDPGFSLVTLNIILSTVTVYLIYEICRESFNKKYIAFIAVTIAAIYPNQIKYVHWFLSEVPAAFFITLSLYFFVKKKYVFSGLAMGFASMIRTTLLPAGILFTIYLIFKKSSSAYKYFAFYSLVILIFLTYGYARTGFFTIGQNAAHNLSITTEYSDTASFPKVHLKTLNGSLNDYISFAITKPFDFTLERLENLWDLWGPMPPWGESWKGRSKFFWLIGIRSILLLLAIIGFVKSNKNPAVIFSMLAIASITVIHMIYFADPRFTHTIEPCAIILASIGIGSLFEISRKFLKPKKF